MSRRETRAQQTASGNGRATGPVCVLTVDAGGFIIQASLAQRGNDAQQKLVGMPLTQAVPAARLQPFREAFAAALQGEAARIMRWHSPAAAFPGDNMAPGRRRATLMPGAGPAGTPAHVTVLLAQEPAGGDENGLQERLTQAQRQLLQSEKMAAIGQLAAGVAHEINNPVGFVFSNLGTLAGYLRDILSLTDAIDDCADIADLRARKEKIDYGFIRSDIESLIAESEDGIDRIKRIIAALKDFSHQDDEEFRQTDINRGIETTLKVVNSELKYKAEVVCEFGELPAVECISSQINQVVMNLLVNAAQAMAEFGRITIRTGVEGKAVWIEVDDDGPGMPPEVLAKIFEPFFTTKPVGKGTGLGLSLSYNIVQKHQGRIDVDSRPGEGSRFRVWLPVRQPEPAGN